MKDFNATIRYTSSSWHWVGQVYVIARGDLQLLKSRIVADNQKEDITVASLLFYLYSMQYT